MTGPTPSTRHCIVSTKLAEAPTGTEFSMVGVSVQVAPVVSVVTFRVESSCCWEGLLQQMALFTPLSQGSGQRVENTLPC